MHCPSWAWQVREVVIELRTFGFGALSSDHQRGRMVMTPARMLMILVAIPFFFGAYRPVAATGMKSAQSPQLAERPFSAAPPASNGCPVSKTIMAEPPKVPHSDRFGFGAWYVNADQSIWVLNNSWRAGRDGNKVLWKKPVGTTLIITGRRLDGPARRIRSQHPGQYGYGFAVTGLYFSSAGCWALNAKAGDETLHFVTDVLPVTEDRRMQ